MQRSGFTQLFFLLFHVGGGHALCEEVVDDLFFPGRGGAELQVLRVGVGLGCQVGRSDRAVAGCGLGPTRLLRGRRRLVLGRVFELFDLVVDFGAAG